MVRRLGMLAIVAMLVVIAVTSMSAATYSSTAGKRTSATGEWSGTWKRTSSPPTTGTMTVTFTQQGAKVSGSEQVVGSACLTTNDVRGTVTSGKIAWTVTEPGIKAKYAGTISGKKLSGKLTVTCSGAVGVGTFSLTKT